MGALLEGPLLWYLNRGTGLTLLVLLSLTTALGVLAMGGRPAGDGGARVPRFVSQSLHRNIAVVSVLALVVHVVTAVLDTYVDIRWWQAVVPWGSAYAPVWTGLGALALDVVVVVVLTSLLRHRIGRRGWRTVHVTAWVGWATGLAHAIGMGTDLQPGSWTWWALAPTAAASLVVLGALLARLQGRRPHHEAAVPLLARTTDTDTRSLEVLR